MQLIRCGDDGRPNLWRPHPSPSNAWKFPAASVRIRRPGFLPTHGKKPSKLKAFARNPKLPFAFFKTSMVRKSTQRAENTCRGQNCNWTKVAEVVLDNGLNAVSALFAYHFNCTLYFNSPRAFWLFSPGHNSHLFLSVQRFPDNATKKRMRCRSARTDWAICEYVVRMNANNTSRSQLKTTGKGNQEQLSNNNNSILHAFIWPGGASSLHLYRFEREALSKIESPQFAGYRKENRLQL